MLSKSADWLEYERTDMKKKIVLWGSDENENKLLLALELLPKENLVKLYSFPESLATEEFYNKLMDEWREDKEVEFPEGHSSLDRPLSMTEDLLPETIRVQRGDVITRAKTEWHFIVLSTKLFDLYKSELDEFRDRISRMNEFDSGVFEELKGFWSKVAEQSRERNLFREHADRLKHTTNELFTRLKEFRTKANSELAKLSKENVERFKKQLELINDKMDQGLGLKPIFDELKDLQNQFKQEKFTREDRSSLWQSIDGAFKKFKEKKYGDQASNGNRSSRLERRYQGLLSAIDKMDKSIKRDEKDMAFQNKRVGETQGQLEMQIRQAKMQMIQERIDSKNHKLADMMATKKELEARLEKEKQRQEKEAEKVKIKKQKEVVKAKIADEIDKKAAELDESADKLSEAAKAINKKPKTKEATKQKESVMDKIKDTVSETIEEVVDNVKAVSEVIEENIEEKVEQVTAEIKDVSEKYQLEEKAAELKEKAEKVKEVVEDKIEEIIDKISGEEEE